VENDRLDPGNSRKHGDVVAAKKKARAQVDTDGHAFTVVLEDLRSQFRAFGEALQSQREHFDTRFSKLEAELGIVKSDVASLKSDVAVLKSDVAVLKSDVAVLKSDVALMKVAILENTRELADHGRQLREIRVALDNKVDRSELEVLSKA
jgi:chromosome segregation ATPase